MSKNYKGKIGLFQLFICLLAAATLFIPYVIEPQMEFAYTRLLPIANSELNAAQDVFIRALLSAADITEKIPEIVFTLLPYCIYVFYLIVVIDVICSLLLMLLRNEPLRIILRVISVILGLALLVIFVVNLATVTGFLAYFVEDGFGENAKIFDCVKNQGFLYFLGLCLFSYVMMKRHVLSFYCKKR